MRSFLIAACLSVVLVACLSSLRCHCAAAQSQSPSVVLPSSRDQPLTTTGQSGGSSSQHPHLFHLSGKTPDTFDGGDLRGAHSDNWPVLNDQHASVYLVRLEPGAIREPHWHPSAWELNYIVQGQARWSLLGTKGSHDSFNASAGDVVFAPTGHFHYFENLSTKEDLVMVIVFNAGLGEFDNDIGIVASLSVLPPSVLGALFNTSPAVFHNMSRKIEPVGITRKGVRGDVA